MAANGSVAPTAIDGFAGVTAIEISVAAVLGVVEWAGELPHPAAEATETTTESATNVRANIPTLSAFVVFFIERLFL
jgi:hypothetical protein